MILVLVCYLTMVGSSCVSLTILCLVDIYKEKKSLKNRAQFIIDLFHTTPWMFLLAFPAYLLARGIVWER